MEKILQILGNNWSRQHQASWDERNILKKEYFRKMRTLLETKLFRRNHIKVINTWAVPLEKYSWPFLKWTREELKQMDQRTRKLMSMHEDFHHRDDTDRLYMFRKEVGREMLLMWWWGRNYKSHNKRMSQISTRRYKTRHDWVKKVIPMELYKKL